MRRLVTLFLVGGGAFLFLGASLALGLGQRTAAAVLFLGALFPVEAWLFFMMLTDAPGRSR